MRKITILFLIVLIALAISGCRLQIVPPSLSFNYYDIDKEEIKEEDTIVGYDYTINAQINVDGSLDGMYYIEVYGDGAELTTYGPVNISSRTIDIEEIVINSDDNYSEITLKLYVWKNDLQQIVSE